MNILFSSLCCAQSYYDALMTKIKSPEQNAQKLHHLLLCGIAQSTQVDLHAISALPISRSNYTGKYIHAQQVDEDGCDYYHMVMINIPIIRNIGIFLQSLIQVLKLSKGKRKETVVIVDVLNLSNASGALLGCKLSGIPCIGIVTDVPCKRANSGNLLNRMIDSIRFRQLQSYDGYIFLSEPMNTLINHAGKPYIVVEGTVDSKMTQVENTLEGKSKPRVCLYSGSIRRIYGIPALVEGFLKANIANAELWIYGDGDYREELLTICQQHANVRYFGVVPNREVVKAQVAATLLVNPRPPIGVYTMYSFPSKNMEYLVSGTPVLAAMLPGMPEEYREHIFELKDCSADGMCDALKVIFSLPDDELFRKGQQAKEFVLKEKNNLKQGERIVKLAERITKSGRLKV